MIRPEDAYRFDECAECGVCLEACPYIKMNRSQARRAIKRMRDGRHSRVLDLCAGCATCNVACPRGNKPYTLIRTRWRERYRRRGLPERARFLMPTVFPNFRTVVRHSAEEKNLLKKYAAPPITDTIIYTGCNTLVFPSILDSYVFAGAMPFGAFEYCCGEMYYRMGLFDEARETGLKLKKVFDSTGVKKVVFVCAACMNMIANVYPTEFGIKFNFEKEFIADTLLQKIRSGKLKFEKSVEKTFTIQDSCHAKMMPPNIHEGTRDLLREAGATVVEREHTRTESLCCGIAAGCNRFSMTDIVKTGVRSLEESRATGADATVAYCNGCQITLAMLRVLHPLSPPMVSMLQVVREAAGDPVPKGLVNSRSREIMAAILFRTAPAYMSMDRFFLSLTEKLDEDVFADDE